MSVTVGPLPRARKHTYVFLEDARSTAHVYLMTDVDATALKAARKASGGKLSFVSLVVKAAAEVVADYPDARAVLHGNRRPRLGISPDVHVKVLFDKTIDGQRCVLSGTVPHVGERSALEVQDAIDSYKDAPLDESGPFGRIRKLQNLPLPLFRLLYKVMMRDPARRALAQGTFAVTSIGHEQVRAIFPMISGTLGFGVGHIADAALVRDGQVVVAPSFTLSLSFDHRVLDGAMASEVLARVKNRLETWEMP